MIEVEVKLALTDSKRVEQKLRKDGFVLQKIVRETDTYFNGVDRDFRKTDEALRVRKTEVLKNVTDLSETDILSEHSTEQSVTENDSQIQSFVTYKGPKLEETSMTRKELEIPIEDEAAMSGLLVALGYHPVPSVIKCRKYYVLDHMTACLDSVEGLGEYLELEILVEQEEDRQQALQQIEERLLSLGYSMQDTTRISYLSMLEKIWEKNGVTYHE